MLYIVIYVKYVIYYSVLTYVVPFFNTLYDIYIKL